MVARAGLPLQDLEFVQFHPTGEPRLDGWAAEAAGRAGAGSRCALAPLQLQKRPDALVQAALAPLQLQSSLVALVQATLAPLQLKSSLVALVPAALAPLQCSRRRRRQCQLHGRLASKATCRTVDDWCMTAAVALSRAVTLAATGFFACFACCCRHLWCWLLNH